MTTKLVTAPTTEPLTSDEAKRHLRIAADDTDDDAFVKDLITAARIHVESETRRKLITQTWDLYLDEFPYTIYLPFAPIQSITSINYLDSSGVSQVLATTVYRTDVVSEPARIALGYGQVWPTTYYEINAINIRFVAGYGARTDVPQNLKRAMLLLIGHWYENREETSEQRLTSIPRGVEYLIGPERVYP